MNTIYINKRPKFAIEKDQYQWILCMKETKRGEWTEKSYFPKLSMLFDELAEKLFRNNTKKLQELKELDNSIVKVYEQISNLSVGLEDAFSDRRSAKKDRNHL